VLTPNQGAGSRSSSRRRGNLTFRLLDERGCLTPGALTCVDELLAEQRAVVERHVKVCPICAQQQATMAATATWLRRGRPRIAVPVEARLAARQAVVRGLLGQYAASPRQDPSQKHSRSVRLWWATPVPKFWLAMGLVACAGLGLLLAHLLFG